MKNFRANISYDGTDFSGVAEQLNSPDEKPIRTVLGELRPLIEMVAQASVKINVSGRTDKGVHARNQVLTFCFPENPDIDLEYSRLTHVCNSKLNPEIVVQEIVQVQGDFHARFSAKSRTYRYFIYNNDLPDFTLARYSMFVQQKLDVEEMKLAAREFVGEQDFTSVCKKDESLSHNVREVFSADFIDVEQNLVMPIGTSKLLCFEISANAFCWNMVRSIVGVLIQVGRGKKQASDIRELLDNKDRNHGCQIACPNGLFLWDIEY